MLRNLRARRRPRYGTHFCAVIAALLLLFSVALLYSRLSNDRQAHLVRTSNESNLDSDPLLEDADPDDRNSGNGSEDRIDELDEVVQDDSDPSRVPDEDDILRGVEIEEDENDQSRVSRYYFDHVNGVIRRAFDKRSIDQWEDYVSFDANLGLEESSSKVAIAFASDDVALDENIRRKVTMSKGIEDALLLKVGSRVSPLREGWGRWFDAKSDFLRRDKMFKSHLELLNPLNNPFLQDPDGSGVTGLTRGDKLVQKGILNQFKKVPFLGKKPLGIVQSNDESISREKAQLLEDVRKAEAEGAGILDDGRVEIKRAERRTLDDNDANNKSEHIQLVTEESQSEKKSVNLSAEVRGTKNENANANAKFTSEFAGQVYADGKRWGYFPGLHPHLLFSNFMDAFFRKGKCAMRVFMVWNSPPWMFSIRHQRGLESLLLNHPDACVIVFSESLELNFFSGFVKDGFKLAVAMPNLDELLKDTPTHVFASVWFEWKKTKFYPTHYSELIRLAALYKYGGIYLDSDIIVLKPLSSLNNTVGLEDKLAGNHVNGAVMAFGKHSPFIMECLTEFYVSYDDTLLRWNGADLLTRVVKNILGNTNLSKKKVELKLQPPSVFFPISRNDISRYFTAPSTETERAQQDAILNKILNESLSFHFWNSLTYSLVPEPESLVSRLINHRCIHCSDIL